MEFRRVIFRSVRTIAMGSTDGLGRGFEVVNWRAPISGPVGEGTLGRIMDVLGRPIDERGPIEGDELRAIHQDAPKFDELSPSVELLETGIKVIDLVRSEEHTSELQSLMRISYAVFCLKKKKQNTKKSLKNPTHYRVVIKTP